MSAFRSRLLKVLKRIDNTAFNITSQPAGIRFLNDDAGHALAILTTPFNPNQPEPLRPGAVIIDDDGDAIAILTSVVDAETNTQNQLAVKARPQRYNGVSWDASRNNLEITVFTSAARTATVNSATQTNFDARGVTLFLNVTAVSGTTPTLSNDFQVSEPVSATFRTWVSFTQATAVTSEELQIYPGVSKTIAVTRLLVQAIALPRSWRVGSTIGGTTPSFTYSIGGSYTV